MAAVALVACSGSGSPASNLRSSTSAVGAAAASGPPTSGGGGPPTVDTRFTGAGGEQYCARTKTFRDASEQLGAGTDARLRQVFQDAATDIRASVLVAPAEIKADVQIVSDGFNDLVNALERVNYDFRRLDSTLIVRFMSEDYRRASTRLAAYDRTVCGRS